MGWHCKSCGDLGDDRPLHGSDDQWHCPRWDCDATCSWIESERVKRSRRKLTVEEKNRLSFEKAAARRKDRAETKKSTAHGRQVLANMVARRTRETTSKGNGGAVKDKAKSEAAKRAAVTRRGICATCGVEKYILRNEPPTCTACYKASPEYNPKPRTSRKKKEVSIADELTREVQAIEKCDRALDGLGPEAIERVLRWVAHRYRPELTMLRPNEARLLEQRLSRQAEPRLPGPGHGTSTEEAISA